VSGHDLTFIYERRCKVCRSEHRGAIDGMLLEGKSQAEVRRYWNAERHTDWLTASSLSRHANRHLDRRPQDISIFDSLPFLDHGRGKLRQREILEAIIDGGMAAVYAGIVVPEPSDVLAALTQRDVVALDEMRKEKQRLLDHFALFLRAAASVLPGHIQDEILEEYLRLAGELPEPDYEPDSR
jgi:hypothetical protein